MTSQTAPRAAEAADRLRKAQEELRPRGGPKVAAPKRFMADGTGAALEREAEAAEEHGAETEAPVHDGPASRRAAAELGARGFQDESGIHLGPGATAERRAPVIAHEQAHAAQARQGRTSGAVLLDRDPQLAPQVPAPRFTRTPIGVSLSVYFAQGSFLLGATGQRALRDLQQELRLSPGAILRIDGYASAEGSDAYNLSLSEHRRMAVRALLSAGLMPGTEISGTAHGEAEAGEGEVSVTDRAEFRAGQRRVDIHIVHPSSLAAPAAPEPAPPIDLRPVLPYRPETDEERIQRMILTPPPTRPGLGISVCGHWREETREWFDHRLRDMGIGGEVRSWLADRGVGLVEDLPFRLIEQGLESANVDGDARRAVMTAIRAACEQEIQ